MHKIKFVIQYIFYPIINSVKIIIISKKCCKYIYYTYNINTYAHNMYLDLDNGFGWYIFYKNVCSLYVREYAPN